MVKYVEGSFECVLAPSPPPSPSPSLFRLFSFSFPEFEAISNPLPHGWIIANLPTYLCVGLAVVDGDVGCIFVVVSFGFDLFGMDMGSEDYIQTLGVNFMEKTISIRKTEITFSVSCRLLSPSLQFRTPSWTWMAVAVKGELIIFHIGWYGVCGMVWCSWLISRGVDLGSRR